MPSEHQGQSGLERASFPGLKDDIGEDPARFLDHDLRRRPMGKLIDSVDERGHEMQRLVPDEDCSPSRDFVKARIDGIDRIEVVRAWKAVERRLDRGPRDRIMQWLDEREQTLEEIGERPERCEPCDPDSVPSTESVVVWPDRDGGERSAVYSSGRRFAARADGGDAE